MIMRFYDAVGKKLDPTTHLRHLGFPEVTSCADCGGSRCVILQGGRVDDPRLALQVALVRFGYERHHESPEAQEPHPCCRLGMESGGKVSAFLNNGRFPTLTVCSACGGYQGILTGGRTIKDPSLGWRMALVRFGHLACRNCDNDPPSHACDCAETLKDLRMFVASLPLVSDSGWGLDAATSRPMRGIRDYWRTMRFERDLGRGEMERLNEWLKRDECPGWTAISVRRKKEGVYLFGTTWDSSD